LSNAMLLPAVTAWSVSGATSRYADCARFMGVAAAGESDHTACDALVTALEALTRDLSVPGPKEFGIDRDTWFGSLPVMAQQALDSGSPANNPRLPEEQDIVGLYASIW
jgi:alcohol dehydrogenase class IV